MGREKLTTLSVEKNLIDRLQNHFKLHGHAVSGSRLAEICLSQICDVLENPEHEPVLKIIRELRAPGSDPRNGEFEQMKKEISELRSLITEKKSKGYEFEERKNHMLASTQEPIPYGAKKAKKSS